MLTNVIQGVKSNMKINLSHFILATCQMTIIDNVLLICLPSLLNVGKCSTHICQTCQALTKIGQQLANVG